MSGRCLEADVIRCVLAGHVAPLYDLIAEIYAESGHDPASVKLGEIRGAVAAAAAGTILLAAAKSGNRFVGYGLIDWRFSPRRRAGLVRLSVLRHYWRQGIGHALMASLIADAAAGGHHFLELAVLDTNLPARRLYERLGFFYAAEPPAEALPTGVLLTMRLDLR